MRRSPDQIDEDRMMRDSARDFLAGRCAWSGKPPSRDALDGIRGEMAGLGWLAMGLPARLGGAEADATQSLSILEEVGRAMLPLSLGTDLLVAPRLAGRHAALDALLERAAGGTTRFAFVEDDVRSGGLQFESSSDGGRLSGRGAISPGAEAATHWLVAAGTRSANGAALLCLEARAESAPEIRLIDGRTAAAPTFDGAERAGAIVLATAHDALDLIEGLKDRAAAAAVADGYGALTAGLAASVDHLGQRRQFGQTLGSFQAVQHLMADAYCDLEALHSLLLWSAAALDGSPAERRRAVCAAKVGLERQGLAAAARMVQVCGGMAVTEDFIVGRVYKRLQVDTLLHGSTGSAVEDLAALTMPAAA